ncbi:MAG: NAD(+) diphosphatase [Alphaproteobacteria bacterium]|nr:NAD(+) diphosphatase [Alphaproteobacteria bacterium]
MRAIEFPQLDSSYSTSQALFFTDEGILVETQTLLSFLPFEPTLKRLKLALTKVYLSDSVLIVKCQRTSSLEHLFERGFYISDERSLLASLEGQSTTNFILKAIQWLAWDEKLQYCSKCGHKVLKEPESIEKKCLACDLSFFPKFSPAVMVLVQRNHEILLARSANFKPGFYSAIAGFIDMGETAELAAHREVKEEVGLEITDLSYFGSQSWPFPDNFMIGFKATYVSGEIKIDRNELEDAGWFSLDHLPELPSHASISRQLIESCLA